MLFYKRFSEGPEKEKIMTVELKKLVDHLDHLLEPEPIEDVAVNGLQVPGGEFVHKVAVSTDATMDVFQEAIARQCDFLFVHHGIFWNYNREDRITYRKKEILELLFNNKLALYASHCPLDIHPDYGNNRGVFDLLGLENPQTMGHYRGRDLGLMGVPEQGQVSLETLVQRLEVGIGDKVKVLAFHDEPVRKVAIITGQGQFGLKEAETRGFDTFITGEINHYVFHEAKELKTNVILAGHYRSETLGPRAIGAHLQKKFDLPWEFLDFPTGL